MRIVVNCCCRFFCLGPTAFLLRVTRFVRKLSLHTYTISPLSGTLWLSSAACVVGELLDVRWRCVWTEVRNLSALLFYLSMWMWSFDACVCVLCYEYAIMIEAGRFLTYMSCGTHGCSLILFDIIFRISSRAFRLQCTRQWCFLYDCFLTIAAM